MMPWVSSWPPPPLRRPVDRRTFRSPASAFVLGLLMGLATLAKSVHLGLVPFVLICALVTHLSSRPDGSSARHRFRSLAAALLVLGGFALATLAEFRENLSRYGNLTVMQEAVENRRAGRGAIDLMHAAGAVPG